MRTLYTQLYVHLVWSTWDRLPLISDEIETVLYASIIAKCKALNCEVLAIGGIVDHIHILVRLLPSISVAELVKEIKGTSSHLLAKKVEPDGFFKWQGGYSAFTIRKNDIETLKHYIHRQKEHHKDGHLLPEWEPKVNSER